MNVLSAPVELKIENNHAYALRRQADPANYKKYGGEIRSDSSGAPNQTRYVADQKFRVMGAPIFCTPGPKELHLSVKGLLDYSVANANLYLDTKMADYSAGELARIRRHRQMMAMLDVELWAMSDATAAPFRSEVRSDVDSDWSPNAPLSRVDFAKLAELYTPKAELSVAAGFFENLGFIKTQVDTLQPTPIVRIDTMATVVVPVVTMHLGARTLSAEDVEASFELSGKCFWMG